MLIAGMEKKTRWEKKTKPPLSPKSSPLSSLPALPTEHVGGIWSFPIS